MEDLTGWLCEGQGGLTSLGAGEVEIHVQKKLTLWRREGIDGPAAIEFECHLLTEHAQLLVLACARAWRGLPLLEAKRSAVYDDYNSGDLEMYTLGFNRTRPGRDGESITNNSANIRRVGGPDFLQYAGLKFLEPDAAMQQRLAAWHHHSLLASVREFASGTQGYLRYRMEFQQPRIAIFLEGEHLLTVHDHRPAALAGGNFGLRCMTAGGRLRVRNVRMEPLA